MKIITKYLGITITAYISLVMLFLFGLLTFIEFTAEFRYIGTGYYGLPQALTYVFLMLPSDIYQFFPMAGLLGCVLALGLLASHSELIVIRASGVSLVNITLAITKTAIILIVIMLIVGEVLAPIAQKIAISRRATALSGGQMLLTQQWGVWIRNGNNFVHIDFVSSDRELQGVTKYEFDDNYKLKTASYAESGKYKNGKWMFKNVVQTIFSDKKTTSTTVAEEQWGLRLNQRLSGITQIDPDQQSLVRLYSYIKHREQSGLNTEEYRFIFWQRVFTPLATLIMILLAIPFVFGPLRSTTMGLRMLVGIAMGFGFHILTQFAGPMSIVYQVPPVLAAILPTMLFTFIGGVLLFKA